MADLQGTNVTAPVRPYTDQDPIPTFHANEGFGGHHNVQSAANRDAIRAERRARGMTCYVEDDDALYVLAGGTENSNWRILDAALLARTAAAEAAIAALQHVPMLVTGLTVTPSVAEIGATVTSLAFAWSRNKVPATLTFSPGIGSVTATLTAHTAAGLTVTTDTVYTLTADDGTAFDGHAGTATAQLQFQHRMWWGVSASTSLASSTAVRLLVNNAFATDRIRTVTIPGAGQYVYLAYPAGFGDATIRVNGLVSTAWTRTTLSYTNLSGHNTNYHVYRSNEVQNGTLVIDIT